MAAREKASRADGRKWVSARCSSSAAMSSRRPRNGPRAIAIVSRWNCFTSAATFVSHPAWLMELRGDPTAQILARLQAKYGQAQIRNIRFAIDPDPPAR